MPLEEKHVPRDIAEKLKEKGFPQNPYICNTAYTSRGRLSNNAKSFWHNSKLSEDCGVKPRSYTMAPTQQMAMRWLRETYGLFIAIDNDDLNYCFVVLDIANRDENYDPKQLSPSYGGFNEYEAAADEGIMYCLDNLLDGRKVITDDERLIWKET